MVCIISIYCEAGKPRCIESETKPLEKVMFVGGLHSFCSLKTGVKETGLCRPQLLG